jgi:hypothetical protein
LYSRKKKKKKKKKEEEEEEVVRTLPSKYVQIDMCPIFNGCGDTAV